jgi:hypothetical protein
MECDFEMCLNPINSSKWSDSSKPFYLVGHLQTNLLFDFAILGRVGEFAVCWLVLHFSIQQTDYCKSTLNFDDKVNLNSKIDQECSVECYCCAFKTLTLPLVLGFCCWFESFDNGIVFLRALFNFVQMIEVLLLLLFLVMSEIARLLAPNHCF